MLHNWNDNQPIYLQLRERIVTQILEGKLKEGEAIPSVRQVATDYRINHLTVAKAYQELVTEGFLEKRRGLGMFVLKDAQKKLLKEERDRFMAEEFPELLRRIRRLGIEKEEIIRMIQQTAEVSK
ncbi:MAG: GntR family transcriptional regulator [Gammaproteobacteria bacterium RIFCSPLOWO2_02_FULL_56_15]|nr:MAG: GntR family transcriptional regulator [Gammaproteobacteria bacterium RIFCSPLOWO2_02_FULL_56_15]